MAERSSKTLEFFHKIGVSFVKEERKNQIHINNIEVNTSLAFA